MTNWKLYRIIERLENGWEHGWFVFHVDDGNSIIYKNGNHEEFFFEVSYEEGSPYQYWGRGDFIEIDNDVTCYRINTYKFTKNDKAARLFNIRNELDKQRDINNKLVSMLNSFSQRMFGNENFVNSSCVNELDLSEWRKTLNKIANKVEAKGKEQTALITKNSTDISVIQVANLALQEQVGEKNQLINAGAVTLRTTQDQLTTVQNQNQQKDTQIIQLNNDLTTIRDQAGQLNTQIVTKDNQITQVTNERNTANEQLTLTRGQIEDLRTLFNNLQITNNNKEQAIRKKEEILRAKEKEIIELRTQLGLLSPEEVLNKKIASGEEELDDLVCTLSLPRQTIKNLRFAYKNLEFNTKVQYNSENITNIDNNIEEIKEELSIFFVENNKDRGELHKIYRSCEQIAKWKVELEQLYQQQYQNRQEQPTNQ